MSVEIHVACRRDPSSVAQILKACRIAQIEVGPARTIRAWSPRAHATLLLRERDVAGVVTFRSSDSELAAEYAELIARALEGVAVVDGEVVELVQHHALSPTELASAWSILEGRTDRILEERQRVRGERATASERESVDAKRRPRDTWTRASSQSEGPDRDRDYSTH